MVQTEGMRSDRTVCQTKRSLIKHITHDVMLKPIIVDDIVLQQAILCND